MLCVAANQPVYNYKLNSVQKRVRHLSGKRFRGILILNETAFCSIWGFSLLIASLLIGFVANATREPPSSSVSYSDDQRELEYHVATVVLMITFEPFYAVKWT